ncbi:MAG: hypothetical protein ACOYYS_18265 [Chloroflexota bacterium]
MIAILPAALPVLAYLAIFFLVARWLRPVDWRPAFIRAALIWGAYLVLVTELLSLVGGVTVLGLAVAWSLPLAGVLVLRRLPVSASIAPGGPQPKAAPDWGNRFLLLGVLFVLGATALVAWVAPPQTYDSLNYHMPRVAHWAQARAVRHFTTGIDVQNVLTPGAEMVVLHFYVLGGGDRLANFPAWLSLLGSLVAASWIAALLGAGRRGQVLAAVVAATIPMSIVQASSTMTDLVAAFWVACVAVEALHLWAGSMQPAGLAFAALGAGLALLTKPTAAAFVLPFGALVGVLLWRHWGWRRTFLWAGIAGLLVLGVCAGHLARNTALYGNPLGDQARLSTHANELRSPQGVLSNLLRNAALHSGSPWGRANGLVYAVVMKVHGWIDLAADDPRTTAIGPYGWAGWRTEENITGNFLHALLTLWCLGAALVMGKRLQRAHRLYLLLAVLGFVLFSAIFKWQKFGGRYHTPFFVLLAPAIACALAAILRRRAAWLLGVLLVVAALPWLFSIDSRPLVPTSDRSYPVSILQESRRRLYFANAAYLDYPYHEIAAYLKDASCLRVGLDMGGMAAEYPLWVLLGAPRPDLQIEWFVSGPSRRYAETGFRPCGVICDGCQDQQAYNGLPLVYQYDTLRLYLQPGNP